MDNHVRRTLLIDSRDRDYAVDLTPSDYRIKLPHVFRDVVEARLVSAELPSSFYVFSSARGNTTMTVTVLWVSEEVTIPDGNYTLASMETALKTALDAAFGLNFTVTISETTWKLSLALGGGQTIAVDTVADANKPPAQWGLAYYLGFRRGEVASGTGILTSPRAVNVNPETYVLLDVPGLDYVDETAIYGQGGPARTFAKVPLNVNSYQYMYYDKDITRNAISPAITSLDRLRIRWRFHDGTPVDFNDVEHSLTLELTCLPHRGV